MEKYHDYLKGRGAQLNTPNPYLQTQYDTEADDGLDEPMVPHSKTEALPEHAKKIINKVPSPDIPMDFSINPYQGCEHGCVYCYARNVHQYWGYSAGLDFERKIIVKKNAPELLAAEFKHRSWKSAPIMFSGNTDCYQPLEREMEITRQCLEEFLRFRNPVGLITKNSLILRDLDILKELAEMNLVRVMITITTLNESLRKVLEPRTATGIRRLETIRVLSEAGIPTGIMVAPIIPGMNNHEIPAILEAGARAGAKSAGMTLVRLNGAVAQIFEDWLRSNFPDRAEKVLNQIRSIHGGKLGESRFGKRMRGEGAIAESIRSFFKMAKKQHFEGLEMPPYNLNAFKRPGDGQLSLFPK